MSSKIRNVLVVSPSRVIAEGLKAILDGHGEFHVAEILGDMSKSSGAIVGNMELDIVIVDPLVLDFTSRENARSFISEFTAAPVVAVQTVMMEDEAWKQYDGTISLYDSPVTVVRKLRKAMEDAKEAPRAEGNELSSREKEILVCVAKGMLNKEIADSLDLSVYTVMTHRKNITKKTGIKTVAGLTVYALLNNLIDPGSLE